MGPVGPVGPVAPCGPVGPRPRRPRRPRGTLRALRPSGANGPWWAGSERLFHSNPGEADARDAGFASHKHEAVGGGVGEQSNLPVDDNDIGKHNGEVTDFIHHVRGTGHADRKRGRVVQLKQCPAYVNRPTSPVAACRRRREGEERLDLVHAHRVLVHSGTRDIQAVESTTGDSGLCSQRKEEQHGGA